MRYEPRSSVWNLNGRVHYLCILFLYSELERLPFSAPGSLRELSCIPLHLAPGPFLLITRLHTQASSKHLSVTDIEGPLRPWHPWEEDTPISRVALMPRKTLWELVFVADFYQKPGYETCLTFLWNLLLDNHEQECSKKWQKPCKPLWESEREWWGV